MFSIGFRRSFASAPRSACDLRHDWGVTLGIVSKTRKYIIDMPRMDFHYVASAFQHSAVISGHHPVPCDLATHVARGSLGLHEAVADLQTKNGMLSVQL